MFKHLYSLKQVFLLNVIVTSSVTSIRSSAFFGCISLEKMELPFLGPSDVEYGYTNKNGYLGYIFGATASVDNDECVPSTLKEIVVMRGQIIEDLAFYKCASITSIVLPNSVKIIETTVFGECPNLLVYCEVETKPEKWVIKENSFADIYWAGEWEYDEEEKPVPLI